MKGTLFVVALLLAGSCRASEAATGRTNFWLSSFALADQSNQPHQVTFPRTNLLVLTVADHKGSQQVESWVRPLKARFPANLAIEGVADVSSVPGLLRPLVQREFKKNFTYPVMLDWSGKVVKPLDCVGDAVNVFAVASSGEVLARFSGPANTNQLAQLVAILEAAQRTVATSPAPPAPAPR